MRSNEYNEQQATGRATEWTQANAGRTVPLTEGAATSIGSRYLHYRDEPASIQFLDTAQERELIMGLRGHSPMGVEDDLGAQLVPYELQRDEVGAVSAMFLGKQLVGTLRFVPSGHGLTSAERIADRVEFDRSILGAGNWEVGRLIIAPEFRHPELLAQCLNMALKELIARDTVVHFYAISVPAVARLWRRFGLSRIARPFGASGNEYALMAGHVRSVAAALGVQLDVALAGGLSFAAPPVPAMRGQRLF